MEQNVISPPTLSLLWTKTADDIISPDSTSLSLSLWLQILDLIPLLHILYHSPTSSSSHLISPLPALSPLSVFRHLPQQHYGLLGPSVSTSALAVGGQHPPVVGGLPAGAGPPFQRPALPTGHGGGGVDAHAPPVRLREDQVQWDVHILIFHITHHNKCLRPCDQQR